MTADHAEVAEADTLSLAMQALRGAISRVTEAGDDPFAAFGPLAEACWWLIALDDGFSEYGAVDVDDRKRRIQAYIDRRNADAEGCVVAVLRYVRKAIGHVRLITTAVRGLMLPFTLPATLGEHLRWMHADEIPSRDTRKQAETARRYYAGAVAGKSVVLTLSSALGWLTRCHAEIEEGPATE